MEVRRKGKKMWKKDNETLFFLVLEFQDLSVKASRHLKYLLKGKALEGKILLFISYDLILREWQLKILLGTNCFSLIKLSHLSPWQSVHGQVSIYIYIPQSWQKARLRAVLKVVSERSEYLATASGFWISYFFRKMDPWVLLHCICGGFNALFLIDLIIFCAKRKKYCYKNTERQ